MFSSCCTQEPAEGVVNRLLPQVPLSWPPAKTHKSLDVWEVGNILRSEGEGGVERGRGVVKRICKVATDQSSSAPGMGVKVLQCFSWYRRCKERCKAKQCPPPAVPREEMKPPKVPVVYGVVWDSQGEGGSHSSLSGSQIYFSSKARLSFRHQMDSNFNAVDATC
ncbi:hypothetical protein J4Q44_G00056220 [Coregonus suidteri]|uniref:Uncharacterized protein n=1 Tax=Coregonus suidteri TaxID=861788 RepID=A0AAN8R4H9_9TELE